MGYDELNSRRFCPFAIAALILGLALGVAMPVGPVAAGVPSDTTATGSAKQALASEAAKTDGVIVVAGTDKNWHNNKNWNNNNTETTRRSWWSGPIGTGTSGLTTAPSSVVLRSEPFCSGTGTESLLVLGRSNNDARLLGLLPIG